MNPATESSLLPRLSYETKIVEGFYWTGKENGPPEVLLTIAEKQEIETFIESHEPEPVRPIEAGQLMNRLRSFASTFHFAFGDANNREVAIAMWGKALSGFSEVAVKSALDTLTGEFTGGILVPGMAVEIAQMWDAKPSNPYAHYSNILNRAKLFHDTHSKEEYIADLEAKREKNRKDKEAFIESLDEKGKIRKLEEEKLEELRMQAVAAEKQKKQAAWNKVALAAKKLKDHKRFYELLAEMEEIISDEVA